MSWKFLVQKWKSYSVSLSIFILADSLCWHVFATDKYRDGSCHTLENTFLDNNMIKENQLLGIKNTKGIFFWAMKITFFKKRKQEKYYNLMNLIRI